MGIETIGERIKKLRKKANISQKALSYNICSQSEISRIENNSINPSSFILQKIAERLGVNVEYFYHDRDSIRQDYIDEIKRQLERYRRLRDYKEIEKILIYESKSPVILKNEYMKKYIQWHKGIVAYHLYSNPELALKELEEIINTENIYSELKVDVLNSIGIICRNLKDLKKAAFYLEKGLKIVIDMPFVNKNRIFLKINYNLSKVYTDMNCIDKSLDLCSKGINYCKLYEDMYLFSEFHYQSGRNWLIKGNTQMGLNFWNKAIEILKIEGKTELAKIIEYESQQYKFNSTIV
ncbi:helix-turn-helix domain-containing protein [Bacillus sp. FJAT-29937]|uniref:helix-turn-helix domain-containing protein n=1 Tax=Bacillus sp. FJAT-29937 TaxID=1720553 RepID=UPI0008297142|nr:helix-turn-helix domain-containing protein [Bacillus sp. FJAT-29937]